MEQIAIFQEATPVQREAAAMHFEIVAAAQAAAGSLIELGRKLKKMRDSGMYKILGFESFGEYTEAAVGIRQRQAYTYISVVETLPQKLIEENAAAGVTKLALLAKLGPEDREEISGEKLAGITVKELQKLVEERDMLSRQMSIFSQPIDAQGEPVEAEEIEEAKRLAAEETRKELLAEFAKERARLAAEADKEAEERIRVAKEEKERAIQDVLEDAEDRIKKAREQANKEAEAAAADRLEKVREEREKAIQAAKEAEEKAQAQVQKAIKAAREEAAKEAAKEQERKDLAELEKARAAEAEAKQRAEALAGKLQLNADEDGVRFILLFEQMREKVDAMRELAGRMRTGGKEEQAEKYTQALKNALEALREEMEEPN